jgi:hypothetical protein
MSEIVRFEREVGPDVYEGQFAGGRCVFVGSPDWCMYPADVRYLRPDLPAKGRWVLKTNRNGACPMCGQVSDKMLWVTEHDIAVVECYDCRQFGWIPVEELRRTGWLPQSNSNGS